MKDYRQLIIPIIIGNIIVFGLHELMIYYEIFLDNPTMVIMLQSIVLFATIWGSSSLIKLLKKNKTPDN